MKKLLVGLAILGMGAFAGGTEQTTGPNNIEPNKETTMTGQRHHRMRGTLVLRVDRRHRRADYFITPNVMKTRDGARAYARSGKFKRVPDSRFKSGMRASSYWDWYFYSGYGYDGYYYSPYYSPYFSYYGYSYPYYYLYNDGYYNYYYYGDCWWGGDISCGYY